MKRLLPVLFALAAALVMVQVGTHAHFQECSGAFATGC